MNNDSARLLTSDAFIDFLLEKFVGDVESGRATFSENSPSNADAFLSAPKVDQPCETSIQEVDFENDVSHTVDLVKPETSAAIRRNMCEERSHETAAHGGVAAGAAEADAHVNLDERAERLCHRLLDVMEQRLQPTAKPDCPVHKCRPTTAPRSQLRSLPVHSTAPHRGVLLPVHLRTSRDRRSRQPQQQKGRPMSVRSQAVQTDVEQLDAIDSDHTLDSAAPAASRPVHLPASQLLRVFNQVDSFCEHVIDDAIERELLDLHE